MIKAGFNLDQLRWHKCPPIEPGVSREWNGSIIECSWAWPKRSYAAMASEPSADKIQLQKQIIVRSLRPPVERRLAEDDRLRRVEYLKRKIVFQHGFGLRPMLGMDIEDIITAMGDGLYYRAVQKRIAHNKYFKNQGWGK